jgi:hypothetical protein
VTGFLGYMSGGFYNMSFIGSTTSNEVIWLPLAQSQLSPVRTSSDLQSPDIVVKMFNFDYGEEVRTSASVGLLQLEVSY